MSRNYYTTDKTNNTDLYSGFLSLFVLVLSSTKTWCWGSWLKNKKIITGIIIFILTITVIYIFLRFSPYSDLKQFQERPYSVRYYDRYGMLLQITPLTDGLRREKSAEIPQQIKDVIVFSEDKRFFFHPGIDGFSLLRAMYQNVRSGRRVSGASTITMQLARIISDNANTGSQVMRQRALGQKIAEAFNALRLEARFSKNEILLMYINSLPFGFNSEGLTSAARTFFSCDISMLSPSQLFCLAVIPRRPNLYNPFVNPDNNMMAAMQFHEKFKNNKKLSRKWPLYAQIDERDFQFAVSSVRRFQYPFELPHLIRLINSQLPPDIYEMFLSIDLALQKYIENTIAGNVSMYYSSRITNGSAIVIDNYTGEILAWVGSADFFNEDAAGQIDGVLALNQPGSSMKPFLYAMALENGFKPTDVIADIPMTFGETEIYIPRNFNDRFNGPMLFRASLASSLNIPAVYLLYRLSVRNYTQHLLKLGFNSIEFSALDAGLGLALGNAPVSLLEQVRAFSVFPRDGVYLPLTWEKTNNSEQTGERIYSSDTARIICSFLSDSSARVLAFGSGRNFRTSFPAIFKTGTANQYQNIVALGASMRYSAGVWMGNFTGETVLNKTGSSIPAAITRDILNVLHNANSFNQSFNNHELSFPQPKDWRLRRICAVSGMDPTEACLYVINEYIHIDDRNSACTWHRIVSGRSETLYPAEYQVWFTAFIRQGGLHFGSRPLEIVNPRDGFVYFSRRESLQNQGLYEVPVEVIGGENHILHVTHNGREFNVERPFIFFIPGEEGFNSLNVRNGDEEKEISFTVER